MAARVELIQKLQADEKARRRDLPDLVFFKLATGVRIGEALAVVWLQVDFGAGTVQITSTLVRSGTRGCSGRAPRVERASGLFLSLRARWRCSGAGS